jgi:hypothetical protein
MADLNKIVDDLSTLTVIEAAELSKLLEEKWGVSAAAPVAAAAVGAGAPAAEEKSEFSLFLASFGDKKIKPRDPRLPIPTYKPKPEEYLKNSFEKFEKIIVAEEHGFTGGVGAAILEWAYTNNQSVRKLKLINTPKEFIISISASSLIIPSWSQRALAFILIASLTIGKTCSGLRKISTISTFEGISNKLG